MNKLTNRKIVKKLYLLGSLFLIYNHNIRNLFKIIFLAVLICDVCTKMFTVFFVLDII